MQTGDTISAIASPPADAAGRGIIRLSGPESFAILQANLTAVARSTVHFERGIITATLQLPRADDADRALQFPCLVALYPAPNSYTAEDSLEVMTVGNPHLLTRLQSAFIGGGARAAEPGEFTARAYFNGRLTLAQAEGVAATIAAASDAQLRAAQLLTGGKLGKICKILSAQLARALALVEAGIDFVDQEDVVPISSGQLQLEIRSITESIEKITKHAVAMERLAATPRVVLMGPPNAGKSTLFNALLGRKRAVVSSTVGTTRDILAEPMHLDSSDPLSPEVLLIDLAGLDADDAGFFNPQMQAAAARACAEADLIIRLHPVDQIMSDISQHLWPGENGTPQIHLRSKCDLGVDESARRASDPVAPSTDLEISALDQKGLAELRKLIGARLQTRMAVLGADAIALEPRHRAAFAQAESQLRSLGVDLAKASSDHASDHLTEIEFTAVRLRLALEALGQITGTRITPDDVLGHIFAGFCVGK